MLSFSLYRPVKSWLVSEGLSLQLAHLICLVRSYRLTYANQACENVVRLTSRGIESRIDFCRREAPEAQDKELPELENLQGS